MYLIRFRLIGLIAFLGAIVMSCTAISPAVPAQVLDLTNWKLTLPVNSSNSGDPDEVKQPDLKTYHSQFFRLNEAGNGVIFRANAGGFPTHGSDFARSELHEMTDGGTQRANWSSDTGVHTMTVREAITALPPGRPSIVAGQIHDATTYVALVRLDGRHMYIKANNQSRGDIDTNYKLGTIFTLTLTAVPGHILVYYNGKLKVDYRHNCVDCYFKDGAYLQSNTKWDQPDAFGEVTVYDLNVSHAQ